MKKKTLTMLILCTLAFEHISAMQKDPIVRLAEIAQLKSDKMTNPIKNETKRLLADPDVDEAINDLRKIATQNGNIIFLQLIRDRQNIDRQRVDDPLLQAILNNDYKAVRDQLKQPYVSIDTTFEGGYLPLHFAAAQETNSQIFHALLKKMKEKKLIHKINAQDDDGQTPLWIASQQGNVSSIRILLQYGANPNIKNHDGQLPVDVAPTNKKAEIKQLMKRAKPISSSSSSGRQR